MVDSEILGTIQEEDSMSLGVNHFLGQGFRTALVQRRKK
jgi:hypothetical protein